MPLVHSFCLEVEEDTVSDNSATLGECNTSSLSQRIGSTWEMRASFYTQIHLQIQTKRKTETIKQKEKNTRPARLPRMDQHPMEWKWILRSSDSV